MSSKANYKVYMDVQIGATGAGRIVFELFNDLTPKTSQNFRGLCTGEYGRVNGTKLHYLNTKFHRIIDGFVIQGGDISNAGGKGGFSIYGRTFLDENFSRTHSCAGLLSMANCGRNTNSSQFFITLKAAPHLDGKHVVFGQVIDGMEVVRKIAKVPIDKEDKPRIPVIVVDCGQVGDYKAFLKYDPFKKEVFEQIRQRKEKIIKDQYMIRKLLAEGMDTNEAYEYKKKLQKCERDLFDLNKQQQLLEAEREEQKNKKPQEKPEQQIQQVQKAPVITQKMKEKFGQTNINKFLDLKLKINQAKALNSKAALEEEIRQNDANYHKMIKKRDWLEKRKHAEQQIESKGISKDKIYLNRNALKKQEDDEDKKKTQNYGWNVYTEDAYYSAHEKRCLALAKNQDLVKERQAAKQAGLVSNKPSEQALNRLQADIMKQQFQSNFRQQKRSLFSRKRIHDEDETVNYINEKNKVYNQKLERNFKTYASAIKTSLEMNSQKN